MPPSTRNGKALRANARRWLPPDVARRPAASVSGRAAMEGLHWCHDAKSRIKPPTAIRQANVLSRRNRRQDDNCRADAEQSRVRGAHRHGPDRDLCDRACGRLRGDALALSAALHDRRAADDRCAWACGRAGALGLARAAGQFVTGTAIGTSFTPALLLTILTLLPMLVLGAVISVAIGAAGALILMRLVKVDSRTAFLAAMPGGVIEMANVAARVGADPLPIMALQTMRVGLTVTVAPFLATILAEHGTAQEIARAEIMSW